MSSKNQSRINQKINQKNLFKKKKLKNLTKSKKDQKPPITLLIIFSQK
jgi:bisphosphoglycerate-independent phosphoglycerate mutase (AlkP superfamily)